MRRRLIATHGAPPPNEGDHGPDLEQQQEKKEPHLDVKEGIREIVIQRLLRLREQPRESRAQPEHGRGSPPRVRRECTPKGRIVDDPAQRTAARPDRAEADPQGKQVYRGKKETDQA